MNILDLYQHWVLFQKAGLPKTIYFVCFGFRKQVWGNSESVTRVTDAMKLTCSSSNPKFLLLLKPVNCQEKQIHPMATSVSVTNFLTFSGLFNRIKRL